MSDISRIRSVVARFFQVSEAQVTESFVFPPQRLQGSLARTTFHSALRRLAQADLPAAFTATTFAELLAGAAGQGGAVAPRPVSSGTASSTQSAAPAPSTPPSLPAAPSRSAPAPAPATARPGVSNLLLQTGLDLETTASPPWGTDAAVAAAFAAENFTPAERAYASSQPEPQTSLLGLWAAKEAVLKCGWTGRLHPRDIEILHSPEGQPLVRLPAAIAGATQHALSITHTRDLVAAMCVRMG